MFNFFYKPLVSIVISNKNSLHILKLTIESLKDQTYKNIEIVIIDAKSTDGSVEYLESQKQFLNIVLISEKDSGISEAYSKGLRNATGDIVGILAADERYYPHTVSQAVKWFKKYPNNIVCGGACKFLNADEKEVDKYLDDYLELERHLTCEHICAIATSFFNRKLLANELFYKYSNKTCPDYELWSRLALKYPSEKFKWFDAPIVKALRTSDSMSFRAADFKQMTADKVSYLEEFFEENKENEVLKLISKDKCKAGIHMWACEQISYINHDHEDIIFHCNKAYEYDKTYNKIFNFIEKYDLGFNKNQKLAIYKDQAPIKEKTDQLECEYNINFLDNKNKSEENCNVIITPNTPWAYAAEIQLSQNSRSQINEALSQNKRVWLLLKISATKGLIGVGKISGNDIRGEKIIKKEDGPKDFYFKITQLNESNIIMIRSGGEANSEALIKDVNIIQERN